ncbi:MULTISPECIES: hypothetical protein [unclassified Roseofilum]|uniref:hypothetical protein n=1 Tax=unclassified Roseofilum TaxID=2620099 RepID=UPI001AFD6588|nr:MULTISPECIES: hypothetical protein [unclassified Roseofilum]MBP0010918.1 hypothetical protein [Roseofilum sp. Belize Diploria]MBP0035316.1 hypothetical protein [Roseofilum sp. Belize BBD 4]
MGAVSLRSQDVLDKRSPIVFPLPITHYPLPHEALYPMIGIAPNPKPNAHGS